MAASLTLGKYLEPNFSGLRSERGADGSLVYTLFGESGGFYYQRKLKLEEFGYSVVIEDSATSGLDYEVALTPYVVLERNGVNDARGGFMAPKGLPILVRYFRQQMMFTKSMTLETLARHRLGRPRLAVGLP